MLGHKQNVFDDFHAAAEWLVAAGWTTAEQLGISGGSNGGLLVGAALTQRPELFAAVVCSAPAARHGALRALRPRRDLERRVRHRRRPRGARLAARLLAVPRGRARWPRTRRCCSRSSTATPGSTRCTPARCAPRCSTRPRPGRPVLMRREADVGHGARAITRSIELSTDTLGFTAAWTGLDLP